MKKTRCSRIPTVAAFLLVVPIAWSTPVFAQGRIHADFNGDDIDDLAIGVPGEKGASGGVNVIFGSSQGLTTNGDQFFSQGSTGVPDPPEQNDNCGAAVAAGDFNRDGFADLAMGCPGEDVGSDDRGAVNIIFGSAIGLTGTGSQFFSFTDEASFADSCGSSLVSADFNGDGFADLAIGCPGHDIVGVEGGNVFNVGRVVVLFGSRSGLTTAGRQSFTQAPDSPEANDHCGAAVAAGLFNADLFADLAMGCPGENVGIFTDLGAVNVIYGSAGGLTATGSQFFSFTDFGLGEISFEDKCAAALATGDFDNDNFDDLAMGCPGHDRLTVEGAGVLNAGRVIALKGSGTGLTSAGRVSFTQATPGVPDTPEANDNCAAALAAGDFNLDGFADLIMGCPGEDLPGNADFGAVNAIYGSSTGLTATGSQFFGFTDFISQADRCATGLATGDFNRDGFEDLAMGCPGHDVDLVIGESVSGIFDAGRVIVLLGSAARLTTVGRQSFTQDTPGIVGASETGDALGFALTGMGGPAGPGLTGRWQEVVQTCHGGNHLQCRLNAAFQVVNPSTQSVPPTALRFYLSADAILDPGDLLLSERGVGTLKNGETTTRYLNASLAEGTSAVGKFVVAFVDANNEVPESNEENNIVPFGPIE